MFEPMLYTCLSFHKIITQPQWVTLKSRSLIYNFILKLLFNMLTIHGHAYMKFYVV